MASAPKTAAPKTAASKPAAAPKAKAAKPAAPMQSAENADFVLKELQTNADDVVKMAYSSMTLPPKQFLDMFSRMGEEYLKFVSRRMQAQAGFICALSQCNNVEDMAKAEMNFLGKAAQDYAEEFDRMGEASHAAAQGAIADGGAAKGAKPT